MRVVDKNEMKEIENNSASEYGYSENLIIETVGNSGATYIIENHLSHKKYGELVFMIGKGNNGADSLSIARHLQNKGYICRAFILFPEEGSKELLYQISMAKKFGVKISEVRNVEQISSYFTQTQDEYIVVDGILGTGFRSPISNYLFEIINIINQSKTITISVDIPSGVNGDTGEISSAAIYADVTLAVCLPKLGLYVGKGAQYGGKILPIYSGIPKEAYQGGDKFLLSPIENKLLFKKRNKFDHKNRFGHVLVIGGSPGLCGALCLASEAALKVGAGLVTAVTWETNYLDLSSKVLPEVMTGVIPSTENPKVVESNLRDMEKYDSVVIGPGMGISEKTREIVLYVLNNFGGPVVLDADAIKVLSLEKDKNTFLSRKAPTVITPHIGEFAKFVSQNKEKVLEGPIDLIKDVVDSLNCCIVLKSSSTFIAFPTGEVFINYFPNDGMATGGSGDVLAGMIGGLLGQVKPERASSQLFRRPDPFYESICLGVMAHTLAGKRASEVFGARSMTAGAIIDHLSESFIEMENRK
jgi:hydroxyethylthiazole kinase-like uncharacterized protein yjeF